MDNRELLKKIYQECSPAERAKFLSGISDDLKNFEAASEQTFDELMRSQRFEEGICCPHCGTTHIGPHGKYKGNPRYLCYDCNKTFNLTTKSVFNGHKKDLEQYMKYIELMLHRVSIRKAAQICGISKTTAFLWRHKFLDTLMDLANKVTVGGVVEADETYFKLSFKGSRLLHRKPHKRGNDVRGAGLSDEFVCVPCAIERNKPSDKVGAISRATNLAAPSTKELLALYQGRIEPDSILCTDGNAEYASVADQLELHNIQLKPSKNHKAAVLETAVATFHINNVNSYHSNIDYFLKPFRGVATKYLNNYLNWNNFMNRIETSDQKALLLKFFANQISTEKSKEVQQKPAIPFPTPYDKFYSVQGVFRTTGRKNIMSKKPKALDDETLEKLKFKFNIKKDK